MNHLDQSEQNIIRSRPMRVENTTMKVMQWSENETSVLLARTDAVVSKLLSWNSLTGVIFTSNL